MKENRDVLPLDVEMIQNASQVVLALNNLLRQRILKAIDRAGVLRVTELCQLLDVMQPAISQNLALLRKAGLVQAKTVGRNVLYSVNYQRLDEVQEIARNLVTSWQEPTESEKTTPERA
jgi:DNA-binding transcriptional ArsR family regulator